MPTCGTFCLEPLHEATALKPVHLSSQSAEFLRFAAVTVVGLIIDISIAWALSEMLLFNLVFAAAAGFATGAAFNFLLHELWTFRRAERQLSARRMLRYCGALGATLTTRLGVVYGLSQILGAGPSNLVVLLLATVLSFSVNYLVSKLFVFQSAILPKTASKGNGP